MARIYEVWMQGYSCTGQYKPHELIGRVKAESFKEACEIALKKRGIDKDDFEKYYDSDNQTYWGCSLFDNEADSINPWEVDK